MPVNATPNGSGFALNPAGKGGVGAFGIIAERDDHGGVPGLGGDRSAARSRKQNRVEMLGLHDLVDAVRAGEVEILGAIGS